MFDNHYYNVNQTTKHIFQRLVLIFHLKNQLTLTIINGHYDCFVFFVCCHPFDKSFIKKTNCHHSNIYLTQSSCHDQTKIYFSDFSEEHLTQLPTDQKNTTVFLDSGTMCVYPKS